MAQEQSSGMVHTGQWARPGAALRTSSLAVDEDAGSVVTTQPEGGGGDAALALSAARGDRVALSRLYDAHARPAYSLAARLVGATAAEDVVHDAFMMLLSRPGVYDPARGNFRSWLLTVVHHRCLNLMRGRARVVGDVALVSVPDAAPEPADEVVRRLQDAAVRTALQELPAAQRESLVLAYYGGLSQSAQAEKLGVPLGTVKARMRRGLIALRGLLRGENLPEDGEEER